MFQQYLMVIVTQLQAWRMMMVMITLMINEDDDDFDRIESLKDDSFDRMQAWKMMIMTVLIEAWRRRKNYDPMAAAGKKKEVTVTATL